MRKNINDRKLSSESKKRRVENRVKMKEGIGSSSSISDLSGKEFITPVGFTDDVLSEKMKEKKPVSIRPQGLTSMDEKMDEILGIDARSLG
ncbi:hypothetical protein TorRG33x02_201900 [Trema orientale]|uniref:Uncharacterized protein n=1 Tax=Trema orientale TaxID=63057 RepID=A0A2P5EEV5_TREOI|nr:hypothetical protein TorRG33x02_201900 [Trema orientale]